MVTSASTTVPSVARTTNLPGRKYDSLFFSTMAGLIAVTVFVGFARTYYLAGVFNAPLPSRIVHIHGALFTSWILLLVTQTSLVASGNVRIHRRLGIFGGLLGCVMVVFGVLAATGALVRRVSPPGIDPLSFYIIPLTAMMNFGTLLFFAIRLRKDSPAHKRLIMIATTAMLTAAVSRWPIASLHGKPMRVAIVSWMFLLFLVLYDLWSTHKVHRVTILGSALVVVVELVRVPIGHTAAFHGFASWVQMHAW